MNYFLKSQILNFQNTKYDPYKTKKGDKNLSPFTN